MIMLEELRIIPCKEENPRKQVVAEPLVQMMACFWLIKVVSFALLSQACNFAFF
jgi:hypothetical protein